MRILVTGSAGHIGREQVRVLREAGHEIRTLDRVAQKKSEVGEHFVGDLRDLDTVRRAVAGMDAIVHLGAIPNDRRGAEEQILSINVQGTWNILLACVEAEVGRVVNFSSINALGCVGERRTIDYFPITDALPHYPMSPYQISKHIGEELCALFAARHGIVTISLRPGFVATPENYKWFGGADPERSNPQGAAELWGYVDRRDVCEAARLALSLENVPNDAFLLFAADTNAKTPTQELLAAYYPDTPFVQDQSVYFAENPYRSLFDCSHAEAVLGWKPRYSWRNQE